jgi:small GTP-binding protein
MNPGAKVVFLGDVFVGKTCLINVIRGMPNMEVRATITTISTSVAVNCHGQVTGLDIWDTPGSMSYQTLAPIYCHGATAAVIVFSVIDPDSFHSVEGWLKIASSVENIPIHFIVANKVDLDREVTSAQSSEFAGAKRIHYFETSAQTHAGLDELKEALAIECAKCFDTVSHVATRPTERDKGKTGQNCLSCGH